jgi:predicted phosphodiesterase
VSEAGLIRNGEVGRVMFLGDTHGNIGWLSHAYKRADQLGCQVIVQCGDFGYWEHTDEGADYLDRASKMADFHEIPLVWIDGNHENHAVLRANYAPGCARHEPTAEGFWLIRPDVAYAPRGLVWTWSDVTFLALGGAYSIDKEYRRPGSSWWPEETITEAEVYAAIGDGQVVDVMVCHDAPAGCPGTIPGDGTWDRKKDAWPESLANRERVKAVMKVRRPKLLVHGHYHHRNSQNYEGVQVEGLGRDNDPQSIHVVQLADLSCSDQSSEPTPTTSGSIGPAVVEES